MNKIIVKTVFLIAGFAIGGCGNRFSRIDPKDDVPSGYAQVTVKAGISPAEIYFADPAGDRLFSALPGAGDVMLYIVDQARPAKMIATSASIDAGAGASATFSATIPYGSYTVAAVAYVSGGLQTGTRPYCASPTGGDEVIVVDGTTTAVSLPPLTAAACDGAPFNAHLSNNLTIVSCNDSNSTTTEGIANMQSAYPAPTASGASVPYCTAVTGASAAATTAIDTASFRFRYFEKNNLTPGTSSEAPSGQLTSCFPIQGSPPFQLNTGHALAGSGSRPAIISGVKNWPTAPPYYRFPIEFGIYDGNTTCTPGGSFKEYLYYFPNSLNAAVGAGPELSRVIYSKNSNLIDGGYQGNPNNNAKYVYLSDSPMPAASPEMVIYVRRGP